MAGYQRSMSFLLLLCLLAGVLAFDEAGESNCCSSCLQCPGSYQCIKKSQVCDGEKDCENGEEEDPTWCDKFKDECSVGSHKCRRYCNTWDSICSSTSQSCYGGEAAYKSEICSAYNVRRLPSSLRVVTPTPEPMEQQQFNMEEVALFVSTANCSIEELPPLNISQHSCPMLYSFVGDICVAILPFQLTWPEAQAACGSISGRLLEFQFTDVFTDIVQYLINNDFTSDYWIGGFFNIKKEAWTWSSGPKMPASTPYWTLKYSFACSSRQSSSLGVVPGCFHYQQAPAAQETGYCAALQYEFLYYISDQGCFDKKKPICLFNTPAVIETK